MFGNQILVTFKFREIVNLQSGIANRKLVMAKSKKPKHIAVAGNIGAGKTTLTELLSKHYKWIPQFEDVDHNPYLYDFYEDMPRWSLISRYIF